MLQLVTGCRGKRVKREQDGLFKALLDAPVMHVDGTVARVNGDNRSVVVCSNGCATMYFARESKGHAGIKGTPVETYGGILIHDHEACFYSYDSDHQEYMVHIERCLKDSIENEKNLAWNKQMLALIQKIIHENNMTAEGMADEKIAAFEAKYDAIMQTATKEYEDEPPSDYYKDGYNLYLRMGKYKHNHLLFLSNPLVEPDNNLCERKARVLKGKINQAISLRSFEHLVYFCECLSVLDHFATDNGGKCDCCTYFSANATACSWLLFGRNPKLLSWNFASQIGSNTCKTHCCISLSIIVSIPRGLVFPLLFGISTLCTLCGSYHWNLRCILQTSSSSDILARISHCRCRHL